MAKTDEIVFTTHVSPTHVSLHDFRRQALFMVQQFRFVNNLKQQLPITVSWINDDTIEIEIGIKEE